MSVIASQITCISIVCLTVCSGADQRKHISSTSLPFVRGIHRWPVDSPHKRLVTRKMLPPDDVIMFQFHFRIYSTALYYVDFQKCMAVRTVSCGSQGPDFNIKMSSYQYGKSHYEDQTSLRPSYLHNGNSLLVSRHFVLNLGPRSDRKFTVSGKWNYWNDVCLTWCRQESHVAGVRLITEVGWLNWW